MDSVDPNNVLRNLGGGSLHIGSLCVGGNPQITINQYFGANGQTTTATTGGSTEPAGVAPTPAPASSTTSSTSGIADGTPTVPAPVTVAPTTPLYGPTEPSGVAPTPAPTTGNPSSTSGIADGNPTVPAPVDVATSTPMDVETPTETSSPTPPPATVTPSSPSGIADGTLTVPAPVDVATSTPINVPTEPLGVAPTLPPATGTLSSPSGIADGTPTVPAPVDVVASTQLDTSKVKQTTPPQGQPIGAFMKQVASDEASTLMSAMTTGVVPAETSIDGPPTPSILDPVIMSGTPHLTQSAVQTVSATEIPMDASNKIQNMAMPSTVEPKSAAQDSATGTVLEHVDSVGASTIAPSTAATEVFPANTPVDGSKALSIPAILQSAEAASPVGAAAETAALANMATMMSTEIKTETTESMSIPQDSSALSLNVTQHPVPTQKRKIQTSMELDNSSQDKCQTPHVNPPKIRKIRALIEDEERRAKINQPSAPLSCGPAPVTPVQPIVNSNPVPQGVISTPSATKTKEVVPTVHSKNEPRNPQSDTSDMRAMESLTLQIAKLIQQNAQKLAENVENQSLVEVLKVLAQFTVNKADVNLSELMAAKLWEAYLKNRAFGKHLKEAYELMKMVFRESQECQEKQETPKNTEGNERRSLRLKEKGVKPNYAESRNDEGEAGKKEQTTRKKGGAAKKMIEVQAPKPVQTPKAAKLPKTKLYKKDLSKILMKPHTDALALLFEQWLEQPGRRRDNIIRGMEDDWIVITPEDHDLFVEFIVDTHAENMGNGQ